MNSVTGGFAALLSYGSTVNKSSVKGSNFGLGIGGPSGTSHSKSSKALVPKKGNSLK
jgi:hypothetical protein